MFTEVLSAIQAGDRARARDLLTRLLKIGQDNPEYWIWMSAVVDSSKERIFCLKEALRLDPQNAEAKRGLTLSGAMPPEKSQVMPVRYQKRNWQSRVKGMEGAEQAQVKPLPKAQFALMGAALLVVVGLVAFAIWGMQHQPQTPHTLVIDFPTETVIAGAKTTPSAAAAARSGSPTPLWMQLKATYTPTALYVNTPHPVSEAYRIGMRAYQRGEWANAVNYFKQVLSSDAKALDVMYYLGESYRMQGDNTQAITIYNQVLKANADFAPAYLGRALAWLAANPKNADPAIKDAKLATQKDPNFGEAFLSLAEIQIKVKQYDEALSGLNQAAALLPNSPEVYLYRAQLYLQQNDTKQALENARKANELDITMLDAYRIIGASLQATGDLKGSIDPLTTYVMYQPNDADAWAMLARAYLAADNVKEGRKALDQTLKLDSTQADAYLLRAQLLLDQKDAAGAADDFSAALRYQKDSYEAALGLGQAYMALGKSGDAYMQFERTKGLATAEIQKNEVMFWSAQSLDKLGEVEVALKNYKKLVTQPAASVKSEWITLANQRIAALAKTTPTATPKPVTATPTAKPTDTRQPTQTKAPAATRQPTQTVTSAATKAPTKTVTATPRP